MSDEEKEVYEIIASMPIDTKRMNILNDITFEAQLLMKSKFVKRVTLTYNDIIRVHEFGKDKEVILTTELNGKRFIIYVSHGKIVSTAATDPEKGERIVGLRPLATLILASKIKPITFKLFEIQPLHEEEKTREAPRAIYKELIKHRTIKPIPVKREEKEEPAVMAFAKLLKELIEKVRSDAEDVAPLYGCKVTDVKLGISRGLIFIKIYVRKKGLFGKCRVEELKKNLKNDVDVIASMIDLSMPYKVDVVFEKK